MDVFARKKVLDEGSGGVLSLKRGNLLQHLGLSAAIVLVASLHLGLRLPFGQFTEPPSNEPPSKYTNEDEKTTKRWE